MPEAAWQLDGEELTGRSTVTMRARSRVDADRVRNAPRGLPRSSMMTSLTRSTLMLGGYSPEAMGTGRVLELSKQRATE